MWTGRYFTINVLRKTLGSEVSFLFLFLSHFFLMFYWRGSWMGVGEKWIAICLGSCPLHRFMWRHLQSNIQSMLWHTNTENAMKSFILTHYVRTDTRGHTAQDTKTNGSQFVLVSGGYKILQLTFTQVFPVIRKSNTVLVKALYRIAKHYNVHMPHWDIGKEIKDSKRKYLTRT